MATGTAALEPGPARLNQPLKGIVFIVCAVFVLSVQDALVKWLTADFAVVQILFIRSVVMALPILLVLYRQLGWGGLRTRRPGGHLLRLTLNLLAFLTFFHGLSLLPLADAVALMLTAPIFMALLSGPLLGEYARGSAWLAIIIGFIGMLLMVNPTGFAEPDSASLEGTLMVLLASVIYTLWMIQTRHLAATEASTTMVFYSAVGVALTTACAMPLYWRPPDAGELLLLGLVGLVSALGHSLLVQAYRYAPVYVLGPFDYTALVWAIVLGFLVWQEIPGMAMLSGAALVVGGGLYLYMSERRSR